MAVVAGLREVCKLYLDSGYIAAGCHVSIQTVGQRAVAEKEAARVAEVMRTNSVPVWSGILLADTD